MTQHVLVTGGGQNAEHGISLETAAAPSSVYTKGRVEEVATASASATATLTSDPHPLAIHQE